MSRSPCLWKRHHLPSNRRIATQRSEFFAIRNLEEAEVYFSGRLPSTIQHHHFLVNKIVSTAVESKEEDANFKLKLVSQFFDLAADDKVSNGFFP